MRTRRTRFSTRDQLTQHQARQLKRLIHVVALRSPFYKQMLGSYPKKPWNELPVINKKIMLDQFDQLLTVRLSKLDCLEVASNAEKTRNFASNISGYSVGLSTGTSGSRGLFVLSKRECAEWAGYILARMLPKNRQRSGKHRIAFIFRANNRLYENINSPLAVLKFLDLKKPFSEILQGLTAFEPTLIVSTPSVFDLLQTAWREGKWSAPKLDKIISGAEVLSEADRRAYSETFQCPVGEVYQCTEGFLGATCDLGKMHLNEDIVLVEREYLDLKRRAFYPIITDLRRTTQPVIRYRLDDVLIESSTGCSCGSPFLALERIEGRSDDVIWGESLDSKQNVTIFPDFIRGAILSASPNIEDFRVVQRSLDDVGISIKISGTDRIQTEEALARAALAKVFGAANAKCPQISLMPFVSGDLSSKRRRVQRQMIIVSKK